MFTCREVDTVPYLHLWPHLLELSIEFTTKDTQPPMISHFVVTECLVVCLIFTLKTYMSYEVGCSYGLDSAGAGSSCFAIALSRIKYTGQKPVTRLWI